VIGRIVGWSLRSRGVVLVVAAALLVLGATQLRDLPVDVLPEFSPPTVEIQTEALGLSAAEVEQLITVPLEQDLLNGVAWLDTIRSESIPGVFLFEWRSALISAASILRSLLAAATVPWLRGVTVNAIVLAGLVMALGAIVDDAIVDVDNIARRLRQHRRDGGDASTARIVVAASLEVRRPIAYATVIMAVAVLPVFFLEGLTGAFLPALAPSFLLALFASMLVALTVTPVLGLLLSRAPLERGQPPLARWLQAGYRRALTPVLRTPRRASLAGAAAMVLLLLGLAAVPALDQQLAPSFKDTDLLIRLGGTPGASHPEMTRVVAQASRELRAVPGVREVGAHVGGP
jgi:Cu/Ag efflux pump CusA